MEELSYARKRAAAYRFLSKAFLEEIPLSFWETVSQGAFLRGGIAPGFSPKGEFSSCAFVRALVEAAVRSGSERVYLDAAADCAALLWGMSAYSVHPYESVYRDPAGVMMQDARDAVVAAYRAAGVQPRALAGNIPEDHLGIELAFMGYLCDWEAEGLAQGDAQQTEGMRAMQRAFLEEHLLVWAPNLCADLVCRAQERAACDTVRAREDDLRREGGLQPLYATLAQTTSEFLACEQAALCDAGVGLIAGRSRFRLHGR